MNYGYADAAISDDSDLIAFGCQRVVYKLGMFGRCKLFQREQIPYVDWNILRWSCILAGCDYLKGGLKGWGVKSAIRHIRKADNGGREYTRADFLAKFTDDPEFENRFVQADNMFLYQKVQNPINREILTLNPIVRAKVDL